MERISGLISKANEKEKLLAQTQQKLTLAEGLAQKIKNDMDRKTTQLLRMTAE